MSSPAASDPFPTSRWAWLWPLTLATTILIASTRSRVEGPSFEFSDKYIHFAVYGLLGSLICRLGKGWRAGFWALLLTSAFGATDEWHQSWVPGRTAEFADWVADSAGAALAIALYCAIPWYRRLMELPLHARRSPSNH